ncbi:MAG: acyl carrier protein [Carnobacterium sp.]
MTFEKIQEIIVDQLDKEEEEVQLTTNFREDLEADSLDLFQIINDIEDEFDIKIESEEGLNTVQDIVTFVEAELAKK